MPYKILHDRNYLRFRESDCPTRLTFQTVWERDYNWFLYIMLYPKFRLFPFNRVVSSIASENIDAESVASREWSWQTERTNLREGGVLGEASGAGKAILR